jgi:hypothetical protein
VDEPLDEGEGGVAYLAPPAVHGQVVAAFARSIWSSVVEKLVSVMS